MSTETIVSELMELIQRQMVESVGESLSEKEVRALEVGRRAAALAMSEMIAVDPTEPLCVTCRCGGLAVSKESRLRSMVTLAGTHTISRRKYHCERCGQWLVPRDDELGIGSGNYSVGVVALAAEVSAGLLLGRERTFSLVTSGWICATSRYSAWPSARVRSFVRRNMALRSE